MSVVNEIAKTLLYRIQSGDDSPQFRKAAYSMYPLKIK